MIQTPRDRNSYDMDAKEGWTRRNVMTTYERVVSIVAEKLGVGEGEVILGAHFKNDLGADSLDLIELVMEAEIEFDIAIPDADIVNNLATVEAAVLYINEKLGIQEELPKVQIFEAQPKFEPVLFEIDKEHRILTTVRRFRLGTTINAATCPLVKGDEGDIFEEHYDKPNTFTNVTRIELGGEIKSFHLKDLNTLLIYVIPPKHNIENWINYVSPLNIKAGKEEEQVAKAKLESYNHNIDLKHNFKEAIMSLEEIDSIPVLESRLLDNKKMKKTASAYKRKLKALAKLNEDMTAMKHILQIEDEE